ncbi:hypothetical protein [Synechococcus sp. CBW1107]|uniref:hypothetical protein n=1 Tax=Synechococcus sp. CBW1107 TaxID=2789857 RepID=UPI002AD22F34|nr:hypothetical protein [Synechococcus sp. CBW1107]CAK6693377.1 hypothetical protein ICNINCKA_01406 [Synechococcus sp. CBW1107]
MAVSTIPVPFQRHCCVGPGTRHAGLLLAGALLSLLIPGPGLRADEKQPTDFGRVQRATRSCERNLAAASPGPCSELRFEQNQQGLLNIRFVGPGSGEITTNLVTFVGVVKDGAAGLSCREGHCRLEGPLSTEVTSVSELGFDQRGLPTSLPSAWPADGTCTVEKHDVRCEAKALSGERWSATAEL